MSQPHLAPSEATRQAETDAITDQPGSSTRNFITPSEQVTKLPRRSNMSAGVQRYGRKCLTAGDILNNIKNLMTSENLEEEAVYDEETAGRTWLKERVVRASKTFLQHPNFQLFNDNNRFGRSIADAVLQKIMERYYILDSNIVRAALLCHKSGRYDSAAGLLVDFTLNTQNRGLESPKRTPLFMRQMQRYVASHLSWDNLFHDATHRMKTRLPNNQNFRYIYRPECTAW